MGSFLISYFSSSSLCVDLGLRHIQYQGETLPPIPFPLPPFPLPPLVLAFHLVLGKFLTYFITTPSSMSFGAIVAQMIPLKWNMDYPSTPTK